MAPVLSYERLRTRSQTALRNTGPPAETPPHVHSPFSGGVSPTFVLRCFICPPPRSRPRQPCPFLPSLWLFLAEQRRRPLLPALGRAAGMQHLHLPAEGDKNQGRRPSRHRGGQMVLYQGESGVVTAGLEAVPGCAAAPGQGQVRDTAEASRLRLILFPPAPLLQTESRELREGVRAVPRTEALLPPQTHACPGAFSICETGQAVDSIIFFLAHKPLIIYCIKPPLISTTFVPVLSN